MAVFCVRPADDPRAWSLVRYTLADNGKSETFVYEREGEDGEIETSESVIDLVPLDAHAEHERIRSRRTRDEMVCDALFVHVATLN